MNVDPIRFNIAVISVCFYQNKLVSSQGWAMLDEYISFISHLCTYTLIYTLYNIGGCNEENGGKKL